MTTKMVLFSAHAHYRFRRPCPTQIRFQASERRAPLLLVLTISRSWRAAFQVCRVWRCACHQRSGRCRLRAIRARRVFGDRSTTALALCCSFMLALPLCVTAPKERPVECSSPSMDQWKKLLVRLPQPAGPRRRPIRTARGQDRSLLASARLRYHHAGR